MKYLGGLMATIFGMLLFLQFLVLFVIWERDGFEKAFIQARQEAWGILIFFVSFLASLMLVQASNRKRRA
jgi:hypothetical protein